MYTKSVAQGIDVHPDFYGCLFVFYILFSWVIINKIRVNQLQDKMHTQVRLNYSLHKSEEVSFTPSCFVCKKNIRL